jgi:hypothetical protein
LNQTSGTFQLSGFPKIDGQIIALTAKLEYFKKTNNDAAAEKKEKARKAKVAKKFSYGKS